MPQGQTPNQHNTKHRLVILISGGGSNMLSIMKTAQQRRWSERFGAEIVAVISNKPAAEGLFLAQQQGVQTAVVDHKSFVNRLDFDVALADKVDTYAPTLVILAGFMRILSADFIAHFDQKKIAILNIHPSLLPAFTGLHTHARALSAGCQFVGATVHKVTAELDVGPIVAQAVVPVLTGDTEKSLSERVLTQEHFLYPHAIEKTISQ